MNDLTVKTVDFMGDGLMALKDNDEIIWTAVNSFCRGLGMNKNERDRQIKNVQSDEVLKRGCVKFDAGVFEPNNETLALQLDYVPLWLAKISITPNMKENNPELVEKLVNYQLKAKDVLAAAFLPKPNNVKALTITSRDICKMIGRAPQSHGVILREIRDCIKELEEMGFNRTEFFIDSTYLGGGGGKETQPQFLATIRGCEYFSGRLEPEERRTFLIECTDRFERLQNVLDGKPFKQVRKEIEQGETVLQLYRNNKWGILVMNDELYNLTPEELELVYNLVPKLNNNGVTQIPAVIAAMLENSERGGKLERIGGYHCKGGAHSPNMMNVPKNKKAGSGQDAEPVDLDKVVILTKEQARSRYNIGFSKLRKIADDIGAIRHVGNRFFYSRKHLDEYFQERAE